LAHHKSALKKIRRDEKARLRNKAVRTRYRNLVKAVREALDKGDSEQARQALAAAAPYLQKAATKGVIHKNKAARNISRLTKHVEALSAPQQ
jgi:small subunit ribosomal protein S20